MFKYSFLVLCTLHVALGLSTELKEKLLEKMTEIGGKCATEVGAKDSDIAEIMNKKYPSTQEGKCMVFCFYKTLNIMRDDGTIDKDGFLASIEPIKTDDVEIYQKAVDIGEKCHASVTKSDDKCLYAADLSKCSYHEAQSIGLTDAFLE